MKILVLSNLYPPDVIGGYEVACAQMVDALMERGHDVHVLTTVARKPVPSVSRVLRRLKLTDIWNQYAVGRETAVVQRRMDAESRLVVAFNVQQLVATLSEVRPDVVYVSNVTGLGGLALMLALRHQGIPWVWQLADSVPSYICSVWDRVVPALAGLFGREIRGTFVSVSQRLVQEMEGLGVQLNGRVEVLPYWIQGERNGWAPRGYMKDGGLRIVSAGRLTPYKGVDVLIEAVARLKEVGEARISLDLFGTVADVDEAHYPALIQRLGVSEQVTMRGPTPHADLMRNYRDYDVFAFPTWDREPFGLGPVEAAAHGGCVPLISQNCGLAEWMVHGVHCLKTAPTVDAIASTFQKMTSGKIPMAALARRAWELAWGDLHLDTVAPRIGRLLVDEAGRKVRPMGSAAEAERLAILGEKLLHATMAEAAAA